LWRHGRRQENSVVWVISGRYRWTQRVVGAVGNVLWDRQTEQLQNGLQGKLMQTGALKRALSVPEDITVHTHCCENLKSEQTSSKYSLIFKRDHTFSLISLTHSYVTGCSIHTNAFLHITSSYVWMEHSSWNIL
jgi:hypothetical protein